MTFSAKSSPVPFTNGPDDSTVQVPYTRRLSMQTATAVQTPVRAGAISTPLPAMLTLLFGLVVLYFVGFSTINVVHNGTHDTRHSNGFPCH